MRGGIGTHRGELFKKITGDSNRNGLHNLCAFRLLGFPWVDERGAAVASCTVSWRWTHGKWETSECWSAIRRSGFLHQGRFIPRHATFHGSPVFGATTGPTATRFLKSDLQRRSSRGSARLEVSPWGTDNNICLPNKRWPLSTRDPLAERTAASFHHRANTPRC